MLNGLVEYPDGRKMWYINGNLHRSDGPAVELANGTKMWFHNGQIHRSDGPAIEEADGTKSWWINGKEYSFTDYCIELKLSKEQICELVLHYA
jgi:hypothetical protein